ncbi:hypothetical protein [Niastella sp. OAS944]|uniref:hypothetical protein n=1 Tax=Niastella sp. OAS944 TaxID=2664089 RepID=UPI003476E5E9|nr:hypothetical protein [Chitinophagaceae bacterium OAS944]
MKIPLLIATGIEALLCLAGCTPQDAPNDERQAWVPVYVQMADMNDISVSNARITEKAGKIYAWGNYIFQNDLNKGIHIIDNSNRANPQKIGFINIPYNTEFAVRGNYIYANNVNDLVVIDISDVLHPQVTKRIDKAFPYINQKYPPQSGRFVCPDPARGIVIDWELKDVKAASCRR